MHNSKLAKTKVRLNVFFKSFTSIISLFLGIIFIILVIFIMMNAIKGFQDYGFSNILLTDKFDTTHKSFWLPFSITMLSSLIALIIALFIGVKSAVFIRYRLKPSIAKWVRIIFETFSGIPSVMFGIFALNSFGTIFVQLGVGSRSVLNASVMLSFMILPTIVSMTLNALYAIDDNLLINPVALGTTKTWSIYKVTKKSIRSNILIIAIIAFSRAIGESMAMSMILQSSPNSESFTNDGFFGIFTSSNQTLGAFISTNMFSDANPEKARPLLYAFGFIMLIIIMILNIFITIYSHRKAENKITIFSHFGRNFFYVFTYLPSKISQGCEWLFNKNYRKVSKNNSIDQYIKYAKKRDNDYPLSKVYSLYKIFLEYLSIIICFVFLLWIFGDILVNGFIAWSLPSSSTFVYTKNSVGQSFFITLLVILVTMVISFPFSLLIAIHLNEYVKNVKLKNTITFFIDSISATPSILFGMFGALFFIDTLGISANGRQGNSLIAGILTLSIVVLPTFIRTLQQAFQSVPIELRLNSYALGGTKFETIRKIVLPVAFKGIITSLILTIGRILSETAPLYLTAGLSSSWNIALDRPGATLTIQIYAQQFESTPDRINIQYEAALLTLILVLIVVLVGYWLIPNWKSIKEWYKYWFIIILNRIKVAFRKIKISKGMIIIYEEKK